VKYHKLVMWRASEADRWNEDRVSAWKAEQYRRLAVEMYVESEPPLADRMRAHGIWVLCPRQGYLQ
jgi:hypothetical protein